MPTQSSLLARLSARWRSPNPSATLPIPEISMPMPAVKPLAPTPSVSSTSPAVPAKAIEMTSTTSTVVTDVENAAIPAAVAVLQAFQTFMTNLGTDPAQVAAKFPGALQVFVGSVELQAPALVSIEFTTLQADVNSKVSGWISSLNAKLAAASTSITAQTAPPQGNEHRARRSAGRPGPCR